MTFQARVSKRCADEAEIDAVVDAMYAASEDAGSLRSVFHGGARLLQTRPVDGAPGAVVAAEHDAPGTEIARRIDLFGDLAHVWSAYESADDMSGAPRRGVASLQLARGIDGRWCIVAALFHDRSVSLPAFQAAAARGRHVPGLM